MRRRSFIGIIIALAGLSLVLRLGNLSPYLVYPDSYTSIVVADTIGRTGAVVANLGAGGLIYPDFFGWTRPGYPLLVALVHAMGFSLVEAGRGIALAAGVASVPAAAWLGFEVTRRRGGALAAVVLASTSFASVVWSGFVLTETTGNLILLILLAATWHRRRRQPESLDPRDYLTGLLLAVAILIRYEYALLAPIILLASGPRLSPSVRWLNITGSAGIILALATLILRPFDPDPAYALSQVTSFIPIAIVGLVVGTVLLGLGRFVHLAPQRVRVVSLALLASIIAATAVWAPRGYPGLITFAQQDGLIVWLGLLGLILMLNRHHTRRTGWLILAGIIVLAAAYFRVNPTMARYGTHLLPLLIVPASYLILETWDLRRRAIRAGALTIIAALALNQSFLTFAGLRSDQAGIWFKPGYEQTAALLAAPYISPDAVIFTAFPEPYFLATANSTQSFTDNSPWIYAPGLAENTPVVVVVDQSLKALYPEIYSRLTSAPPSSAVAIIEVSDPFRYITQTTLKPIPVTLYTTTLGGLQSALK